MSRTILTINAGSASVKFSVFQKRNCVVRGSIDHFGPQATIRLSAHRHQTSRKAPIHNSATAFTVVQKIVTHLHIAPTVVAHRIVHGGPRFSRPVKLTPTTIKYLHQLIDLAPLHQPVNLLGVAWAKKAWPKAVEWGVFDTAIYRAMSAKVKTYALPKTITKRLHIEKYGFHGLAHSWAFHQAAKKLHITPRKLSVVTVHLGSGASMTLWKHGRPIDTTMGFTPLEGLVMSTRSGDIDPSIPLYIQERLGWSAQRVGRLLEQHAGLLGISGLRDMRDVLVAAGHSVLGWPKRDWSKKTQRKAVLALAIYVYHVRRTLASYLGLLKVQAIVFTGPVGTNPTIQKIVLNKFPAGQGLPHLTIVADEEQAIVDAISA